MISKSTTPGHEMTWVLFENADASMMLVKKRHNGPRRKSAARNLQEENTPPPTPLLPSAPANGNYQEAPSPQVQTQTTHPPFEPPPPYSPRQDCVCHNGLSKPLITPAPPPTARIPPPPPRPPVPAEKPVRSGTNRQLGKSCPDLARLVAKSVQNVKDSMSQDQEKRVLSKSIQTVKDNMAQEQEKKAIAKSTRKTKESLDREPDGKLVGQPVQKAKDSSDRDLEKTTKPKSFECFTDRVSQEHGKQALAKATQNATNIVGHEYEKKARQDRQASPPSPQNALEELISTKLDAVLTSIDGEAFSGNEKELGKACTTTCFHDYLTRPRHL